MIKHPNTEQEIIDSLNLNYGIEVMSLRQLPLGADMQAFVYKALACDDTAYFIKLKYGKPQDVSTDTIEMLLKAGIQNIIPIIKTIDGQYAQPLASSILTVSPYIEGQDGFSRSLSEIQWKSLGKTLRQVHEIVVPTTLKAKIRRESFSPKWRNVVQSLFPILESKPVEDPIAVNLHKFMNNYIAQIHRLVDRADQLAQIIQSETPEYVFCHSDIHAGNVFIDTNDAIFLVDWDEAIIGPKERDLMFIGGGVGNIWNKPHEEEWFYEGYGKTGVNRTVLAYYRHERIVEDIALYGQQLLLSSSGGTDRLKWYKEFTDQFEPGGVVDVAFKTDCENAAGR